MMKMRFLVSIYFWMLFITAAQAQGIGPASTETPHKWGFSNGGPFLPGKTDAERWSFLAAHQSTLLRKSKFELILLFGHKGDPGIEGVHGYQIQPQCVR